jgi:signal transduction histidine kinase
LSSRKLNLRQKFLLTIIGLVAATSISIVLLLYHQLSEWLINEKYQQLHQKLDIIEGYIQQEIEQLRQDSLQLAQSPVTKGLLQSSDAELAGLIRQREWQESLTVLFHQTLATHPSYFKLRFMEYTPGKAETPANSAAKTPGSFEVFERLVAVKQGESIRFQPPQKLQPKSHREYIANSLSLKPNQVYLSEFSLNREFNEISPDKIITLRAVAPVYFNQQLSGFMVISLDASALFNRISSLIGKEVELYVYRHDGQFLYHPDNTKTKSFEFSGQFQYTMHQEFLGVDKLEKQADKQQGLVYKDSQQLFAMVQHSFAFDPLHPERKIRLALTQNYQSIRAISQQLSLSLLIVGLVITLLASVTGFILFRNLSRPIQQLLQSIEQFGKSQDITKLPVERNDEIGLLARSFQQMAEQVVEQTAKLQQENLVRRFTEKRLIKEEQELKRSNSELEKFAYVASHDLQEPLRKVQAFGDRLYERSHEQLDDKSRDYLQRMQSAAKRMSCLINDLLAFSRIATQGQAFKRCDLNEVLSGVLADLEIAIETSQTQIEIEPLPEIEADEPQIRQLLQNLLGNGLKFRKPQGQHKIKIWSKITEDKQHIELHVKDNGIGFDSQYGDRIFEVFQRLHARHEYEGTGIGLAICRKIVERHGGSIRAISEPNQGAEFIVTLPIEHSQ